MSEGREAVGEGLGNRPLLIHHESVATALVSAHVAPVPARLSALAVDWLLASLPASLAALLTYLFSGTSPWAVAAALAAGLFVGGLIDLLHVVLFEGGLLLPGPATAPATVGKRLCRLHVLGGRTGAPLPAPLAGARRAVLLGVLLVPAGIAVPLAVWRNTGSWVLPVTGLAAGDWLVAVLLWLCAVVPFLSYRFVSFGGQWPHDRFASAVVVRPDRFEDEAAGIVLPPAYPDALPALVPEPTPFVVPGRFVDSGVTRSTSAVDPAVAAAARAAGRPPAAGVSVVPGRVSSSRPIGSSPPLPSRSSASHPPGSAGPDGADSEAEDVEDEDSTD